MKICTVVLSFVFSMILFAIANAAAPPQLYGKSIVVSWTDNRLVREIGVGEQLHPVLSVKERTIYVSTAGRTFSRERVISSAGGRRGSASGIRERAPGDSADVKGHQDHINFQGHTMTWTTLYESGARQLVVNFDAGFTSCTAQVTFGKEGAKPQIVTSTTTGKRLEVHLQETSSVRCTIQDGNALSS
jgi:hypothetical protein